MRCAIDAGRRALAAAAAQSAAARRQSRSRQAASPARGIEGLDIPATSAVTRAIARRRRIRRCGLPISRPILRFPSSSGRADRMPASGLPRSMIAPRSLRYLARGRSRNFSSRALSIIPTSDGLFRKYRIVFVDGRPYACHLAIADRWDIWYLNAGMSQRRASVSKKRPSCALSTSASRAAMQTALAAHRRADRSGLFYGRLRGNQKRDRC